MAYALWSPLQQIAFLSVHCGAALPHFWLCAVPTVHLVVFKMLNEIFFCCYLYTWLWTDILHTFHFCLIFICSWAEREPVVNLKHWIANYGLASQHLSVDYVHKFGSSYVYYDSRWDCLYLLTCRLQFTVLGGEGVANWAILTWLLM